VRASLLLFSSAIVVVAALAATPATAAPADDDRLVHVAADVSLGLGNASSIDEVGDDHDSPYPLLLYGATLRLLVGPFVAGVTTDAKVDLFDPPERHTGLLLGGDLRLWHLHRRGRARFIHEIHLEILGEHGRHEISGLGDTFLGGWGVGGERSATLPYAGLRIGTTIETRYGVYIAGWLSGRHDLEHSDNVVLRQEPCWFCGSSDPPPAPYPVTYHLGGDELVARFAIGVKL